ncbi:hypothetical protein BB558_003261 [Smittium angustum]|uniref:Glycoside hydrolase family 19 catalytic domain-containing protein n=1 Tax=Smittium angustum TaxID=133377 RepID=A0A2U1J6K9_SMIAN|nr:hypothetical protein BB558_003261 [Smittium angustum]
MRAVLTVFILATNTFCSTSNVIAGQISGEKNNLGLTCDMFYKAVISSGYPKPLQTQCNSFLKGSGESEIANKMESAMFLSQTLWESDGLRAKEEYLCKTTNCHKLYRLSSDVGNSSYHGRGYIQLTWSYNYEAASFALFGDDRLLKNPDLVSKNEKISWDVSFWYWGSWVRTNSDVLKGKFGASTKMINGALECNGADKTKAKKRFEIYKKVLAVFEPKLKPIENGCYN